MAAAGRPASRRKHAVFLAITLLIPVAFFVVLELALRARGYGGDRSLFDSPAYLQGRWLMPRARVARRWFAGDPSPPTPPNDVFLARKPANALRIFVLGESTTAGFPFAHNGTFSRVLRDALRDVLPADTVEVVNLGIPATSSYALVDQLDEILEHRPDAVLVYAGHNEYYGALAVASTARTAGAPGMVRFLMRLQGLKTVLLLQNAVAHVRRAAGSRSAAETARGESASRMEELVRDARIAYGGETYRRGLAQFDENLGIVVERLRRAGVPVFVASLASNLRDQPPFGSSAGAADSSASATFALARTALDAGDSAQAAPLFARARDLDLVRFRASGDFNAAIQRIARGAGATYVPVAEAFATAAHHGIPGRDLFFEHVHPTAHGYALIGRTFYDALAARGFLGRRADVSRLAAWPQYEERMELTRVDARIADIVLGTIMDRWPFVPAGTSGDFRARFRPGDAADSLALAVATGRMPWTLAKIRMAEHHQRAGDREAALAEYRGLMRDQPYNESHFRFAAQILLQERRTDEARRLLEHAYAVEPTAFTCYALAMLLRDAPAAMPRVVALLDESLRLRPNNPPALFQLSLAVARTGDVQRARAVASQLRAVAPGFPGLEPWLRTLGIGNLP